MTPQEKSETEKSGSVKRNIILMVIGLLVLISLAVATAIISQNGINTFFTKNQRYILSIEIIVLAVFFIEMLAKIITLRSKNSEIAVHSSNWRLIIRIIGYTVGVLSVISILASNTTLGISVGAIAGVVIAFATQNISSSVLAAIVIVSTRMIRVGEVITIQNITGTITDIGLIHTHLSVDGDIIFIPNALIVANIVRRKKRVDSGVSIDSW